MRNLPISNWMQDDDAALRRELDLIARLHEQSLHQDQSARLEIARQQEARTREEIDRHQRGVADDRLAAEYRERDRRRAEDFAREDRNRSDDRRAADRLQEIRAAERDTEARLQRERRDEPARIDRDNDRMQRELSQHYADERAVNNAATTHLSHNRTGDADRLQTSRNDRGDFVGGDEFARLQGRHLSSLKPTPGGGPVAGNEWQAEARAALRRDAEHRNNLADYDSRIESLRESGNTAEAERTLAERDIVDGQYQIGQRRCVVAMEERLTGKKYPERWQEIDEMRDKLATKEAEYQNRYRQDKQVPERDYSAVDRHADLVREQDARTIKGDGNRYSDELERQAQQQPQSAQIQEPAQSATGNRYSAELERQATEREQQTQKPSKLDALREAADRDGASAHEPNIDEPDHQPAASNNRYSAELERQAQQQPQSAQIQEPAQGATGNRYSAELERQATEREQQPQPSAERSR